MRLVIAISCLWISCESASIAALSPAKPTALHVPASSASGRFVGISSPVAVEPVPPRRRHETRD